MKKVPLPRPQNNIDRLFKDLATSILRETQSSPSTLEVDEAIADLRQRFAEGRRVLFAAGRIGPSRRTDTGTTLRLVTVIGTAGLKITDVQPPVGPRAA